MPCIVLSASAPEGRAPGKCVSANKPYPPENDVSVVFSPADKSRSGRVLGLACRQAAGDPS